MIEINLLSPKDVLPAREARLRWQLLAASFLLGVVVASVFGVAYVLERVSLARVSSLEASKASLSSQFSADLPKLSMLVGLKDKASGITKVKQIRPDLSLAIMRFNGFTVDGVGISKLSVSADGALTFGALVRDENALSAYLGRLTSGEGRKFLTSLSISSLTMTGSGGFSFSATSTFDKAQLFK